MAGMSLQLLKVLHPTFNATDVSLTLKEEQIISIYYGVNIE